MKRFQQLSSYLPSLQQAIFILADMTLAEYGAIVQSEADRLEESSEKVIDMAMKYGYESAWMLLVRPLRNSMGQPQKPEMENLIGPFRLQLSLKITE